MLRLARILRKRRVKILHSHLFYASLFASPIGWVCGVPVIIETPHVREDWRRAWLKSRFFVDRFIGRFVDYFIAVSEANGRHLVQQKHLPAKKVVVIHNGSDLRRFDPERQPPAGMREQLGFGPIDPIFLVAGRLEPQKGHAILLDAWPAVLKKYPNARLVCLGEGSLRGELESKAHGLQISDSVRFPGRQPDTENWLALSTATILPSFYEGLPLVAVESLAAGRTMVATAVDGTPEVIVDGRTGLLVPAGDSNALANAILRLLRDPSLRERLARQGRDWAVNHFDEKQQLSQTETLYERALEKSGGQTRVARSELRLERKPIIKSNAAGGRT
jgi:glycosyltransferase involved in cell wall biosynthesis